MAIAYGFLGYPLRIPHSQPLTISLKDACETFVISSPAYLWYKITCTMKEPGLAQETLTGVPFSLGEPVAEQLAQAMRPAQWRVRKKQHFSSHDLSREVYLIAEGTVLIGRKLNSGREAYQYIHQTGEWIGDLAVMEPHFPSFFAAALEPTKLWSIPAKLLHPMMMEDPHFNFTLINQAARRLRQLQQRQQAMLKQNTRERILSFLCEYCLRCGNQINDEVVQLPNLLSHSDLAKFTATSRQSVNALLTGLRREGVLDYDEHQLRIPHPQLMSWQKEFGGRFPFFLQIGQQLAQA